MQPERPAHPTLALVLRHAAGLASSTPEDAIAGRGAAADEARALFCWLAARTTQADDAAVGYAVALSPAAVRFLCEATEARRRDDTAFSARTRQSAIEVAVEARLIRRKILVGVPDQDANATARRVLGGDRQAVSVAVTDLVHLAASYELLVQSIEELGAAATAWTAAAFTPGERAARDRRDRAERSLLNAIRPSTLKPQVSP